MEATIHGLGKGNTTHHGLNDALHISEQTKTHSVTSTSTEKNGGSEKSSSDSYTNAHGVTVTARPDAHRIVTTRDDLIHAHLESTSKTTVARAGNVTKTHTDATADLDKTDHATVANAGGTTTIDAHVNVDAKTTADSTSVRSGDTTKSTGQSEAHVEKDAQVVVTGPGGATTTSDSSRTTDSQTVSAATVTSKNGKTTVDAESATEFSVKADGTIVDAHGKKIVLHETGHGEVVTQVDGTSSSKSSTVRTAGGGVTVSDSTSKSERDQLTNYEGVLSSTTAGGKTVTRYIEYRVEDDIATTAHTHTVDEFSASSTAATSKAGKPGGTVTQTVDATSDSQSQIISQRTDAVHATSKADKDGDGVKVRSTDHVDAQSVRATTYNSAAHIVTDNGAIVTTTDRTVSGQTVVSSETDATVKTVSTTDRDANSTSQTIRRNTQSETEANSINSYDAHTVSSSSNGATSVRNDHVVSATEYDIQRTIKYVAFIRTVITPAQSASFAASA